MLIQWKMVDTMRRSIFPANREIIYVSLDFPSIIQMTLTRKWNDNQNASVRYSPAQSTNPLHSCCTRDSQTNICMCLRMRTFDFVWQGFTTSFDIYTATRMRGLYFDFVTISFIPRVWLFCIRFVSSLSPFLWATTLIFSFFLFLPEQQLWVCINRRVLCVVCDQIVHCTANCLLYKLHFDLSALLIIITFIRVIRSSIALLSSAN